ncbi:MAG: hybrid sensor histidine kinase/response regulator [Microcoleaceae cyanobacterium]
MKTHSTPPNKSNIMVIDDTPENLRLFKLLLTKKGYTVQIFADGESAIASAKEQPPHLILLDINMPGLNGYQVCEKLKADHLTCDIPVIFISALNEVFDKVKAFQVGGVDYITKPFDVEELLARINTHLYLRNLQEDLQEKNKQLEQTLLELQRTQTQLINSEKMAALGQLVAGIAHELNTPFGAIRASIDMIANFVQKGLFELYNFMENLPRENHQIFWDIVNISDEKNIYVSTKEMRNNRKKLAQLLKENDIANYQELADMLADMKIDSLEGFLPLLRENQGIKLFQKAYEVSNLKSSTNTIITATEKSAKVIYALKVYNNKGSSKKLCQGNIIEGIETVLTLYTNYWKRGINLIKDFPENLPETWFYPDDLHQVWIHLIQNALQAMNYQGTLTIKISIKEEKNVWVEFTDSGAGISPDILALIFEPFFSTKSCGEGSGLGLNIVKKIIDKHHGKIEVESEPGQTTFRIILPVILTPLNNEI